MLGPSIFYNMIVGGIYYFQYFTSAYVVSGGNGAPEQSTLFYSLYLYDNAFTNFKMGYASAQAWILFLIILTVTVAMFRFLGRRVFYMGAP
jgi:multiple sugar transport system permease protein